jgi:uncharacterized protein YceH (UPF0502 family)
VTITPEGGRVLGCLVEKQLTTPQQYPLTLNALTLACSQTTNRDPIMTFDDGMVERALEELKVLRLVRFVLPSHGKSVTRYRQVLDEAYGLDSFRVALLAVLLLRGPQTPGELRTRTGRTAEFSSVGAVNEELGVLARQPEPLVRLLPRRPGQKEDRWQQLLAMEAGGTTVGGGPASTALVGADAATTRPPVSDGVRRPPVSDAVGSDHPTESIGARRDDSDLQGRVRALESEVAGLRDEIVDLRASLDGLRRSLGE